MHRIVIGHEGSAGAHEAIDLIASMPWPTGTVIRLVTAVPDLRVPRSAWGRQVVGDYEGLDRHIIEAAEAELASAAERLAGVGLTAETAVIPGRPSSVIADEAARIDATLVAVGSRGRGAVGSAVLGSVSQEVVDVAPCPVLVARRTSVSGIALATDGSEGAIDAERFLVTLPIAREVPVRVVSTAEIIHPWMFGVAPTMYQQVIEAQVAYEREARREHAEIAAAAVTRLRNDGVTAEAEIREGEPAHETMAAAEALGADLIVTGCRGRTGLTRLVLGSVARRILHHATVSVLVVRAGAVKTDEPAPD